MQVLQCLRLGPFQKIVENCKNIILLHLHSIALSKLQAGTQIHHCIVWFQKLPLLLVFLDGHFWNQIYSLFTFSDFAYLSLWWLAAATRAFLCVNECRRLKKILWVEHCTKIKVFIFEPQTFYGHTSKNYTTVYFYNVFITAYILICTGSYLGTVSFHNILYFYQQSNEKVFVKVWKIG